MFIYGCIGFYTRINHSPRIGICSSYSRAGRQAGTLSARSKQYSCDKRIVIDWCTTLKLHLMRTKTRSVSWNKNKKQQYKLRFMRPFYQHAWIWPMGTKCIVIVITENEHIFYTCCVGTWATFDWLAVLSWCYRYACSCSCYRIHLLFIFER